MKRVMTQCAPEHKLYEAPEVELVEINVEQGFGLSDGGEGNGEDYEEGGPIW